MVILDIYKRKNHVFNLTYLTYLTNNELLA